MYANSIALGRNWSTAETCSLIDFGDCFRVDLRWTDGGYCYHLVDTKSEALAIVRGYGFSA